MARLIAVAAALVLSAPAEAAILGADAPACVARDGSAIEVAVTGLKDRTGSLKLELFPATEDDFLKDDRDLIAQGKVFRRVSVPTPASGPVTLCIRTPAPGRYALFFTHDRDGKNKFNVWTDGAGIASNEKLGRAKPQLAQAVVDVPRGVRRIAIRAQYLRGIIPSFGPIGK